MAKQSTKLLSLLLTVLFLLSAFISIPVSSLSPDPDTLPASVGLAPFFPFRGATSTVVSDPKTPPNADAYRNLKLYPGGMPFGVKFITEGVIIVGFHEVKNRNGSIIPSEAAGLRRNDVILQINGTPVTGAAELARLVDASGGKSLDLLYSRNGTRHKTRLTPAYSEAEGRYSTGIYVRDSGAGIGTVTFILPETCAFAGLGHGICDSESGELIPMQRGSVVDVTINGVVKGLAGSPGEVKGFFNSGKIGSLIGNTHCGVYGVLASRPKTCPDTPLPIGLRNEVAEGKAFIYCTTEGNVPKKYAVEISEIQRDSTSNKCFTVKVTDEALLAKTGGIIQGMSGSPIIQNGKLVGAVTHVLINDPTTGYGIFIENMLGQMGDLAE